MYYRLVKALPLRSAQGMGMDEVLSETVAEVVAKMNTYTDGGRESQQPPAA
jgi:5'(3')-deoxyribonucleotidase